MHLVLAYRPGWQSLEDLNAITGHVSDIDPAIRTFIVPSTHAGSVSRRKAAALPTLVVSPGPLIRFKPLRGKVYQGYPLAKFDEIRRLAAAGVPVPRTAVLTPELRLDPALWGELVVLKPTDLPTSSHGRGISLMRTSRVRFRPSEDYPPDHPGWLGPMLVQQYIDTGETLSVYRVLTLFGEPLYAQLNQSRAGRIACAASDEDVESAVIALQAGDNREGRLINDPDVLALARRAHQALPEIPLKGCDILRQSTTGKLFVIELNSGGNTWHFSSNYAEPIRRNYGAEFELLRRQQFDALRTAARVLVARTRREAE